jgi:hypothetical protein
VNDSAVVPEHNFNVPSHPEPFIEPIESLESRHLNEEHTIEQPIRESGFK